MELSQIVRSPVLAYNRINNEVARVSSPNVANRQAILVPYTARTVPPAQNIPGTTPGPISMANIHQRFPGKATKHILKAFQLNSPIVPIDGCTLDDLNITTGVSGFKSINTLQYFDRVEQTLASLEGSAAKEWEKTTKAAATAIDLDFSATTRIIGLRCYFSDTHDDSDGAVTTCSFFAANGVTTLAVEMRPTAPRWSFFLMCGNVNKGLFTPVSTTAASLDIADLQIRDGVKVALESINLFDLE